MSAPADYPTLYSLTGDVKDINTLLVPASQLEAIGAGGVSALRNAWMPDPDTQSVPVAQLSAQPVADEFYKSAKYVHDTFKADLDRGFSTRDKLFAVEVLGEALAAAQPVGVQPVAYRYKFLEDLQWQYTNDPHHAHRLAIIESLYAAVQPVEVQRVPLTIWETHAICAKLHDVDDPLDDMDEGWEEVMKLVAAIEAHHGIQPKGEKQ